MIRKRLKGMGVALITPFKEDGSVDYDSLLRLVEYQVQNGIDFLCVLGTTAETPLYVFWQIISSTKVNLTIEPLKTSENTTGALACGTGFLHWYVAPFTNQEASYFNTSGGTLLGAIQTDHNPTTSAVGKAGSTQIIIKTADLYSVPAGEYSGTLVLNISTT